MTTINPPSEAIREPAASTKPTFELIQIFRGVAAIMVVLFHCNNACLDYFKLLPFNGLFYLGMFGVDFFFVLSGFIITYIHLKDLQVSNDWKMFVKKRFFRIYPIYWVFATITLCYLIFIQKGKPNPFEHFQLDHTLSVASFSDWLYLLKSYALIAQNSIALVDVSWTLCYEVMFYAVFAVCVRCGWVFSKLLFFCWIALIIIKFNFFVIDNFYVNVLLNPLILEFLTGCALAYIFRTGKVKLTTPLFLSLSSLLAAGAFVHLKIYHHQLGWTNGTSVLIIIAAAALLIWACASLDLSNHWPVKKLKTFLLVGDGSYSIYLTHTLVIKIFFLLALKLFLSNQLVMTTHYINIICLVVFGAAVILGTLFHVYVEKPLLSYTTKKFLSNKPPVAVAS